MALVTISGFPCSGKTTRAKEIAVYFNRRAEEVAEASSSSGTPTPKYDVVVVDDAGCHVVRAAYDGE
jgi:protein KTI12